MIGLLLKNPYVLLTGGFLIISAFGGYSLWMYQKGKNDCMNRQKTAIIQSLSDREKIEHENQNLDRVSIIRDLDRNKWLRNGE